MTPCFENEGPCSYDKDCYQDNPVDLGCNSQCGVKDGSMCCGIDLRCAGTADGCCTLATPCGLHDGDCDNDGECKPGLVCGNNNCDMNLMLVKNIDNDCCEPES